MASERKANILLVDDQPSNLLALEAILEDLGQNLVRATSGEEALRRLLDSDFAVILMDVKMPGLDGIETAAIIRERNRSQHTPIIFLTAFERSEVEIFKGYRLGAVDYLFKPPQAEVLRSKVSVFVELHLKTEQVREQAERLREMPAASICHPGRGTPALGDGSAARGGGPREEGGRDPQGSGSPQGRVPGHAGPRAAQPAGADC